MNEKKQKKNSKGITLIALVITIIVLLILAGVSIATLTGDNGILAKASSTKNKQSKAEMKEQLILAIQELQVEKKGKATIDDITEEWVNEKLSDYSGRIVNDQSIQGKKVKMKKDGVTERLIIDLKLNIIEIEYDGSIEFWYEEKEKNDNAINVVMYIQDEENGLEKIEGLSEDAIMLNGTKEEVIFNYAIEIGKEYKIIITSKNGEKREEVILITYYYNITTNLGEGLSLNNEEKQIEHNHQYIAKILEDDDHILGNVIVTMGGETVEVDSITGNINIERVTGDIEIIATSELCPNLMVLNSVYIRDWSAGMTSDVSTVAKILFDGRTDNGGGYYSVMLNPAGDGSYIDFTVMKDLKIYTYSYSYRDAAGSSGATGSILKWNGNKFVSYKSFPSQNNSNGKRYELVSLEKGRYRMQSSDSGYITFSEWELERIN